MYLTKDLRFLQEGDLRTRPRKKNFGIPFYRTKTVLLHRLTTIPFQIRSYRTYDPGPHGNEAKSQYKWT